MLAAASVSTQSLTDLHRPHSSGGELGGSVRSEGRPPAAAAVGAVRTAVGTTLPALSPVPLPVLSPSPSPVLSSTPSPVPSPSEPPAHRPQALGGVDGHPGPSAALGHASFLLSWSTWLSFLICFRFRVKEQTALRLKSQHLPLVVGLVTGRDGPGRAREASRCPACACGPSPPAVCGHDKAPASSGSTNV